jgi:hypothetical protein
LDFPRLQYIQNILFGAILSAKPEIHGVSACRYTRKIDVLFKLMSQRPVGQQWINSPWRAIGDLVPRRAMVIFGEVSMLIAQSTARTSENRARDFSDFRIAP